MFFCFFDIFKFKNKNIRNTVAWSISSNSYRVNISNIVTIKIAITRMVELFKGLS